jgi:hypothetical protein
MTNQDYLAILKQGVDTWNQWHCQLPQHWFDETIGRRAILPIDVSGCDLSDTNLCGIDLTGAHLDRANLRKTALHNAKLMGAQLIQADLSEADLSNADLRYANLNLTNLRNADLRETDLRGAQLIEADLSYAMLCHANLQDVDLTNACLRGTVLDQADMTNAHMHDTALSALDLRSVRGLDTVKHIGPSSLGSDTLLRSAGKIPVAFLRGVGLPDSFITYVRSLVTTPITHTTCFINYVRHDEHFARQLYTDLQANGIRCWFALEEHKNGDKVRSSTVDSVCLHDKLLLILSRHSITNQSIEQKVEIALARERKEHRSVLFPIRLDEAVMDINTGWPTLIRHTRHIGDFTQWKINNDYQKAFNRLLRNLQSNPASPSREEL